MRASHADRLSLDDCDASEDRRSRLGAADVAVDADCNKRRRETVVVVAVVVDDEDCAAAAGVVDECYK